MNPDKVIMTVAEFMDGAKETTLLDTSEDESKDESKYLCAIRELQHRRDRDWSILNGQVVGAEVLPWDN